MRILIVAFVYTLLFTTQAQAQDKKAIRQERIETQRIAFITQRIDLKPEEAQQFWPIFNEFTAKMKQIRQSTKWESLEDASDAEAEKMILAEFDKESRELELTKEYFQKFKKVLSVKKIAKLYRAERDFKAELLRFLRDKKEAGR